MRPFASLLVLTVIASNAAAQEEIAQTGRCKIERARTFNRLLGDDILWGSQYYRPYLHPADPLNGLACLSPLEGLLQVGSLATWNPRLEPLTYYHRSGPVGAAFYELRTRNKGADSKAPVGIVGLNAGTLAAYARSGQTFTIYESSADLKKLVADTDLFFSYIPDARKRGATIEIQFGNARKNLEREKANFALLFVELYEDSFNPGERMTLEAVKLYRDRVTEDGIVAIHISNKYYHVEPVVAAIANELKLAGRIWHDVSEGFPGKTSSSWVLLARSEKALGSLGKRRREQVLAFGSNAEIARLQKYGPEASALEAMTQEWGGEALSLEAFEKQHGKSAAELLALVRRAEARKFPLNVESLTEQVCGSMFRPLVAAKGVGVVRDGQPWPLAATTAPRWLKRAFGVPLSLEDE